MTAILQDVADNSFDYIICGGGTAGLTLAVSLSEDPRVSVVILEAGQAHVNEPDILRPASYGSHFSNDAFCWAHQTTKQADGLRYFWYRGKGLGGSSGVNFLCWTIPPAEDINNFERLGNPGWNWKDFEKYLKRVRGFVLPKKEVQTRYRLNCDNLTANRKGPFTVSYPPTIDAAELKIQQTLINAGIPIAPNPLNGDPTGVFFSPISYDPTTHGRSYATSAYYLPNKDRPNLTVLVSADVTKILHEKVGDINLTATGVEFQHSGLRHIVYARKEVIVAAGTLKSPQILELSGIGNKEVLQKLMSRVSFELRGDVPFNTLCALRDPAVAAQHLELHASGSGLYTIGIIGFAFVTPQMISCKVHTIKQAAKINIMKNADTYPPGLMEQYKIQLEQLEKGIVPSCELISYPGMLSGSNLPAEGKRYVSILAAMNHCFSRGTIHSISNDPMKDPQFDPHYFEHETDLEIWLEAVKYTRSLAQVAPLKDMITSELNPVLRLDKEVFQYDLAYSQLLLYVTKDQRWCRGSAAEGVLYVLVTIVSLICKWQRVYGTSNIRVVDLSVVPLHIAAHTQAIVYTIAEQAADIVKGKFGLEDPTES
ncbi:GMC oxidoreductase [Sparassis crispa]|uniref:GMC oxidoreductase n=1 Tax=Sparassis crispa TaxID=139825 RepID=A0A401GC39_9APHY|nr:GMC oxidoreductase [Sparassis crispa]GBE79756.1 GMC oxidoreductase [Sparassis crispa]